MMKGNFGECGFQCQKRRLGHEVNLDFILKAVQDFKKRTD
jgi:hypothetical protein